MRASKNTNLINIILIGMAGAGKSTVGPLLAEKLGFTFIDTDDLIVQSSQASLQQLLESCGMDAFQAIEEHTLVSVAGQHLVIATGGSAIYSTKGMLHLQQTGTVIWLDVPLEELEQRVNNVNSRGLINPTATSFADLFTQRLPLYRHFAAIRIDCARKTPNEIATLIRHTLKDMYKDA